LSKKSDTALLSKLVSANDNQNSDPSALLLAHDLFATSSLLSKANVNVISLSNTLRGSKSINSSLNALRNPSAAALDYVLFNDVNAKMGTIQSELTHWTLGAINNEAALNSLDLNFQTGLFYSPSLSYSNLESLISSNQELSHLSTSLGLQLTTIRQQR
jgi:hypothetical protein